LLFVYCVDIDIEKINLKLKLAIKNTKKSPLIIFLVVSCSNSVFWTTFARLYS